MKNILRGLKSIPPLAPDQPRFPTAVIFPLDSDAPGKYTTNPIDIVLLISAPPRSPKEGKR
jgi:hypothetical protein